MIGIARNASSTQDCLNRYFSDSNGRLVDQFSVEFQIWDLTGTPTQVQPLAGNDTAVRFGLGSYWAPWTAPSDASIGRWEVRWFNVVNNGDPVQEQRQPISVMVAELGICSTTIINVQEIREAGLDETEISNLDALELIDTWQDFIVRRTRQFFTPQRGTLKIDGQDGSILFFGVPIIGVESVTINLSATALAADEYIVYGGIPSQLNDYRRNPKIALRKSESVRQIPAVRSQADFFSRPQDDLLSARFMFLRGKQNQSVVGVFGHVESNLEPPAPIRRALLKLVAAKRFPVGSDEDLNSTLSGRIIEEETDRHRIKYSAIVSGSNRGGSMGVTGDPEVEQILNMYKAPLSMGATGTTLAHAG